ncbi:MAG: hypothetical protein KDN19_14040 [Verrucomicrobiae bacterium]|nr:hypothetical protein [Verrucomicrobiae bacterium]
MSESDREWVSEKIVGGPPEGAVTSALWGENGELWKPEEETLLDFSEAGYHGGKNDFPEWEPGANVRDFGAKGDGVTDDTAAFARAIEACPENAAVFVPDGSYLLMDWLGVDEMKGTWVKPKPRSHFVIRGESREGAVLLLGVGLEEIHPWAQTTGNGRPTSQWSWSGGFLWFQDGTEVGVENLTIRGNGGPYGEHWKEPGRNGIFFRDVEHAWVRDVTLIDVDSGILVNNGSHITLENLLFTSTENRPSTSDFEDNEGVSGHHAILFGNGSSWCVADDITFENRFHHELGVNPGSHHCVFSDCSGPNLHFDFHTFENDIENILFTDIDAGEGDLIWRNNFYGSCTGGAFWNVRGKNLALPEQKSWVKHPVAPEEYGTLFVGWAGSLPKTQEVGRPWFEEIDPEKLFPPNIYHAQQQKRFQTE